MRIDRLEVVQFRNYEHEVVEFSSGLNIIVGDNGQGKTNLLEAAHLLATLGSPRVSSVGPLVRHGYDEAIVRAQASSTGRALKIDAVVPRFGGIKLRVNGLRPEGNLSSGLASVFFSPLDLELVRGGPEHRRAFVDDLSSMTRPLTAKNRQEFDKVLRHRNAALKAASANPRARSQLEVWTTQLIEAGVRVVKSRLEVLDQARPQVVDSYARLAGRQYHVQMSYQASWTEDGSPAGGGDIRAALETAMQDSKRKDLERGLTSRGPHRDDVKIELNNFDSRLFASQGEQRTLALALRMAQRQLSADWRGEDPILLLDDVFSELDEARREQVGVLVETSGQTIASTTSAEAVPWKGSRILGVSAGRVVQNG